MWRVCIIHRDFICMQAGMQEKFCNANALNALLRNNKQPNRNQWCNLTVTT